MKIVIDTNVLISKDYNGENVTEEFNWGSPVGKEVW